MSVDVRLPTVLRPQAGGRAEVSVDASTVGELIAGLVQQFPGLEGQLVDASGTLRRFVNVYVNDDDVRYLDQLDTPVADGDVVSILPAVAGGSC